MTPSVERWEHPDGRSIFIEPYGSGKSFLVKQILPNGKEDKRVLLNTRGLELLHEGAPLKGFVKKESR